MSPVSLLALACLALACGSAGCKDRGRVAYELDDQTRPVIAEFRNSVESLATNRMDMDMSVDAVRRDVENLRRQVETMIRTEELLERIQSSYQRLEKDFPDTHAVGVLKESIFPVLDTSDERGSGLKLGNGTWAQFQTNPLVKTVHEIAKQAREEKKTRLGDSTSAAQFVLEHKRRIARIACINNLKQIGLAFRIFAVDNGGRFPSLVPSVDGGAREESQPDEQGDARNSLAQFRSLRQELGSPQLLRCPLDTLAAATSWDRLTASNISYRVRIGESVAEENADEVLAWCPVHHALLRCDGSVQGIPDDKWAEALSKRQRSGWRP